MRRDGIVEFDEIGFWSEIKLDIIKEYAQAYSRILTGQLKPKLYHIYIDAFAGAGVHASESSGEMVQGSPLIALSVEPPFCEYHFVELNPGKAGNLQEISRGRSNVTVYRGDCNKVLIEKVYPLVRFEDYRRALCLLDPYGLHLNWELISGAGKLGTIDLFLNFPVMDMNRNVIWRNPERVSANSIKRMNSFWGDESWRDIAYRSEPGLFGPIQEKADNDTIAEAFRSRLSEVGGFKYVLEPLPMKNRAGTIVYYLFFAAQKPVAPKIVEDIFEKYKRIGQAHGH